MSPKCVTGTANIRASSPSRRATGAAKRCRSSKSSMSSNAYKTHRCIVCGDWWSGLADISISDGDPNIYASSQSGARPPRQSIVITRTAARRGDRASRGPTRPRHRQVEDLRRRGQSRASAEAVPLRLLCPIACRTAFQRRRSTTRKPSSCFPIPKSSPAWRTT